MRPTTYGPFRDAQLACAKEHVEAIWASNLTPERELELLDNLGIRLDVPIGSLEKALAYRKKVGARK